jgi:hypothetical protein
VAKPVYATGDVPTADEFNDWLVGVNFARKLSDTSVTSSTTLIVDGHLQVAVDANAVYELRSMIIYDGAAAADLKLMYFCPVGTTFDGMGSIIESTGSSYTDVHLPPYAENGSGVWGCNGAGATMVGYVNGLVVTGVTAGTIQVHWAQFVSNATPTRLFTNSYLKLNRVE